MASLLSNGGGDNLLEILNEGNLNENGVVVFHEILLTKCLASQSEVQRIEIKILLKSL
jgi:hypothetical protein